MMNPQQVSSGSDDRKRKRMISNRESARRSRMKKQQHLDELLGQVTKLKCENSQIAQKIESRSRLFVTVETENSVLRARIAEMADRLRSLNSVLQIVEEASGHAMEIPGGLLEPWQHPCPSVPIMATSDVFQS